MPQSARGIWWVRFVMVFALCELWAIGTPLFAGPDEPAHVIKAASVVRGELLPDRVEGTRLQFVEVPERLDAGNAAASCLAFLPRQDATCIDYRGSGEDALVPTLVGRYPPVIYAVLGIPTLASTGVSGIFAIRTIVALITAICAACAFADLDRLGGVVARVGGFVALTPMALFLSGTVNPSAIEIAAGLLVWTSGLRIGQELELDKTTNRSMTRAGLASLVFVQSRLLSPLWLAVIVAVLVVGFVPVRSLRVLLRSTVAKVWLAVVAAAALAQTSWVLLAEPVYGDAESATDWTDSEAVRESVGRLSAHLREMVGVFGWLDTPAPWLAFVLWIGVIGALVVVGATVATARERIALVLVAVAVVVIPVAMEASRAREMGLSWHGRYSLPVAIGVPLLTTIIVARRAALPDPVRVSAARLIVGALAVAHLLAYWQLLHRYSVGVDGPLLFFLDAQWQPPVPGFLLLVAYAAVIAAFAWSVLALSPAREPARPAAPLVRTSSS